MKSFMGPSGVSDFLIEGLAIEKLRRLIFELSETGMGSPVFDVRDETLSIATRTDRKRMLEVLEALKRLGKILRSRHGKQFIEEGRGIVVMVATLKEDLIFQLLEHFPRHSDVKEDGDLRILKIICRPHPSDAGADICDLETIISRYSGLLLEEK